MYKLIARVDVDDIVFSSSLFSDKVDNTDGLNHADGCIWLHGSRLMFDSYILSRLSQWRSSSSRNRTGKPYAAHLARLDYLLALISASQPDSQTSANTARPRDTGWCITGYACLLSKRTPGTHSSLGRLRLSRPGFLVSRRVGLPVQRRSPI